MRKKGKRIFKGKDPKDLSAASKVLFKNQSPEPYEYTSDMVRVHSTIQKLVANTAVPSEFDDLVVRINMAILIAKENIPALYDDLVKSILALSACRNRYLEKGMFGFTNQERLAVVHGALILEEIIKNSPRAVLHKYWNLSLSQTSQPPSKEPDETSESNVQPTERKS